MLSTRNNQQFTLNSRLLQGLAEFDGHSLWYHLIFLAMDNEGRRLIITATDLSHWADCYDALRIWVGTFWCFRREAVEKEWYEVWSFIQSKDKL